MCKMMIRVGRDVLEAEGPLSTESVPPHLLSCAMCCGVLSRPLTPYLGAILCPDPLGGEQKEGHALAMRRWPNDPSPVHGTALLRSPHSRALALSLSASL